MKKNINMTEGKPLKLIFFFALPLMFGNIFQQLYTVVDTAIVGQGVGMQALAALGTVDWLNWMATGIALGYTQGFSVRIAQNYGRKDIEGLKRTVAHSARLSIVIAIIFTILGELGLPLFLFLLRVPSDLMSMASLYTRILWGGFIFSMFYNYTSSVLRAVGDSKTPLLSMIVACITNIGLDILFVFYFKWGIAGAAIATVIAQCAAGIICAYKIYKTPELHFNKKHLNEDSYITGDLARIGTPVAAKNLIIAVGGMTIQTVVNGFGMAFIAGFTASNKLFGLLEIAAVSYGYAITTYVGQNFGANLLNRIKEGMKSAIFLSIITSLIICIIMFLFGREITMIFIASEDPESIVIAGNTAYLYLCTMAASLPALYLIYVYQAALNGMGNTMVSLVSGFIEFFIRAILAFIIGMIGFENGIFGAEVAAWFGSMIYLGYHYYKAMKKLNI